MDATTPDAETGKDGSATAERKDGTPLPVAGEPGGETGDNKNAECCGGHCKGHAEAEVNKPA